MIAKALEKLLKEMEDNNENHNIDRIHVWLCQNMNEELAEGVMNEEKTIFTCYQYLMNIAKSRAFEGAAMISDEDTFEIVRNYYTDENVEIKQVLSPKQKKDEEIIELENQLKLKDKEIKNLKKVEKDKKEVIDIIPRVAKKTKTTKKKEVAKYEQLGLFD